MGRARDREKTKRFITSVSLAASLSLAAATPVSAATTIGQLFEPLDSCAPGTFLQTAVAGGTSYVVPAPGAIASWSFYSGPVPVRGLELRVAQSVGKNEYKIVGESAAGAQLPHQKNTYRSKIPVIAGDVIGIHANGGEYCGTVSGEAGDRYAFTSINPPEGSAATYEELTEARLPVSAVIATSTSTASTTPAASIGANDATLRGVVDPETETTVYFQYGSSGAYGGTTAHHEINSSQPVALSAHISGLTPGATYHYRLVAENAVGVSYGADQAFTTTATTTTTSTTTTTTSSALSLTGPPVEKGLPVVNTKTGEITSQYEFAAAGEAQQEASVVDGATVSRSRAIAPFALREALATLAVEHKRAKRCKRGYVKKGKRCVRNAPVLYGRAKLAAPAAGTYTLRIRPGSRVLAALKRGRTLNVRLALVFTPAGTTDGISTTTTTRVHLRKRARSRSS